MCVRPPLSLGRFFAVLTFSCCSFQVLTEIYQSTYGDSCWENVDGWEENNKDMMQWYGLLLDRGGNIVKLRLRDNGLEGFLPPSVADLKSLMILDLSKNYIEGRVPDLSPLKEVSTYTTTTPPPPAHTPPTTSCASSASTATGSPASARPSSGTCPCLRSCASTRTNSTAPSRRTTPTFRCVAVSVVAASLLLSSPHPSCPQNIRHLDLGRNNLSGTIPGELGDLVSLCTLNLNDNFFSGPVPTTFTRLTNLGEESAMRGRVAAPLTDHLSLSLPPRAAARRISQALRAVVDSSVPDRDRRLRVRRGGVPLQPRRVSHRGAQGEGQARLAGHVQGWFRLGLELGLGRGRGRGRVCGVVI